MRTDTITSKKEFHKDFHYFRAISILIIVLGHSVASWPKVGVYGYISSYLKGSTGLFVFISGYFFQYLCPSNFIFFTYLKKKRNNVVIPYIALTTLLFAYFILSQKISLQQDTFLRFLSMLFYGRAFPCYWYIPFATLLFLSAPAFIWIKEQRLSIKLLFLILSISIAIIIRRPVQIANPIVIFHSFFYFAPYYLMGILFCQYQETIERYLYNPFCLILSSLSSFLLIFANVNYWNKNDTIQNTLFINDGLFTYLSKICLIISMLIFTRWMMKKKHVLSEIIGNTSFAIYFLHSFFMQRIMASIKPYSGSILRDIISISLITITSAVLSVIVARFAKNICPTKSKYIIGY